MAVITKCPSTEQLRQLLAGSATPAEQREWTAHLDQCTACQKQLETLSGASPALLTAARVLDRTPPDREISLRRVLDALKSDSRIALLHSALDRGAAVRALLEPTEALHVLGELEDYEVTEVLGQGGMGLVLKAFDHALKRAVAIKVLAPDLASDPLARQRFAREAQAAAAVRHEHVITIYAVSEANGLPFFVMEFVSGGSLQDYLLRHGRPSWQDTAHLGAEVASGLAAAHARGLIHRDIKPSNILLQPGTTPASPGSAKISDFGLAHIADEVRLTQTGIVAGTPMYMAPEQALNEPLDSRADLFSLGSVLYTLCTGQEPFPANTAMAVIRQVCETTPRPILELNPDIPDWLVSIVERLHAKRPEERLDSAAEVAELLRYNLQHPEAPRTLPKLRPRRQQLRRTRRLVLVGLVVSSLVLATWLLSHSALLNRWLGSSDASGVVLQQTLRGHDGLVWSVAFSPDSKLIATGSDDATWRLWDAATGKQRNMLPVHQSAVLNVQFAHSGQFLLTGGGDAILRIWDYRSGKELAVIPQPVGSARRAQLSPDDSMLAVSSVTQEIELWNVAKRQLRVKLPRQHGSVQPLAFSPDGQTLASGDATGRITLWDPSKGTEIVSFEGDPLGIRALSFTPDSKTLISAGTGEREVKLWDVTDQHQIASLTGFTNDILNIAISPDGRLLATGTREGTLRIWDLASHVAMARIQAHQGSVLAATFSRDQLLLATAGEDRLAKIWDLGPLVTKTP